jgi:elongator complex protein 2
VTATLEGHKESVTSLAILPLHDGGLLVASSSADNTIMLWRRDAGQSSFKNLQTISFAPKMIETVSLTFFPGTTVPLLAAGGVDMMIHLYTGIDGGNKFVRAASLQGHEDWIRFVSFVDTDNGDVLLASSSQDKRIRLWRVSPVKSSDGAETKLDPAALLAKLNLAEDGNLSMSQHAHVINLGEKFGRFTVLLESVILGHEEWVNSVCWAPAQPHPQDKSKKTQPMRLLSASMDRTAAIWAVDEQSGIWIDETRVGEVGGNQLGFFGSQFGPNGDEIIVVGWNGAFHLWRRAEGSCCSSFRVFQ